MGSMAVRTCWIWHKNAYQRFKGFGSNTPLLVPLPKAGVFAHGQAEVVAHNIAIANKGVGTQGVSRGMESASSRWETEKLVLPVETSMRNQHPA
jgi:hypothetical protein